MQKIILIIILFINSNAIIMAQNTPNNNIKTITEAYAIPNAIELKSDTLLILNYPSGQGCVSWFIETENNKIIIVDYQWLVKPNAKVIMHSSYLRTPEYSKKINLNLKYGFHYDKDLIVEKNSISLTGETDKNTKVDIIKYYPYWTKTTDKDFLNLLNKYNLTIKETKL